MHLRPSHLLHSLTVSGVHSTELWSNTAPAACMQHQHQHAALFEALRVLSALSPLHSTPRLVCYLGCARVSIVAFTGVRRYSKSQYLTPLPLVCMYEVAQRKIRFVILPWQYLRQLLSYMDSAFGVSKHLRFIQYYYVLEGNLTWPI